MLFSIIISYYNVQWAVYSLVFVCGVLAGLGAFIDELSINKSVKNDYNQDIVLKCGWKTLKISIDSVKYTSNYDDAPRSKQAGNAYIVCLLIGYLFMMMLFIPLLFEYIKCFNNLHTIRNSKLFALRSGPLFIGVIWIIGCIDWTSTEHCCKNWYSEIDIDINNGTDCDWYISIFLLLIAAFISLSIAFYTNCIWDVKHFHQFYDENYLYFN